MTAAELYRNLLLGQALDAAGDLSVDRKKDGDWLVFSQMNGEVVAPTLTDALSALLRDLDDEPIEWPSAEEVAGERERIVRDIQNNGSRFPDEVVESLLLLARREPLVALALLFGEGRS